MGSNAPNIDISEDALVNFETAVMSIPQFDTENQQMISQGPSVCIFNKEDSQEVLASWLFVQYLLTNEVQIAYSSTEGYVPVTSKAQASAEYQDYLSRGGEDNEHYYDVKIQATKLLIEHTEDTFVTPVFNGSATLRDEAGQLIESVVKSTRRQEEITDEYIEELYSTARLNVDKTSAVSKTELGPLPATSMLLMWSLAIIWIILFVYIVLKTVKSTRNRS